MRALFSERIISFTVLNIFFFSFITTKGPSSWFARFNLGISSSSSELDEEDDEDVDVDIDSLETDDLLETLLGEAIDHDIVELKSEINKLHQLLKRWH